MASVAEPAAAAPAQPARQRGTRRIGVSVIIATTWLVALTIAAALAPHLGLQSPFDGDLLETLAMPSADHWLGTDSLGRDTFARLLYGGQVSLTVSLGSVGFGIVVGGALGLVAGYFGALADRVIMGVMTVLLCFPALILAIALIASLGPNIANVTLAIGIIFVPAFARITRANTLSLRSREFVLAAEALGAKLPRILLREILPNLMPALLSYAVVMLGVAILAEAALGFLGLSVRPPQPSWGGMIASERVNLADAPQAVFIPAAFLFITVLAINLLGEALRRIFDIRAQTL
jgi:ABC-type dipeptide/oligopeptide/nickel transport system permease subunit